MNCLLLLIILCCCGQGSSSGRCGCRANGRVFANDHCRNNHFNISNADSCGCQGTMERESNSQNRMNTEREGNCGCSEETKKETKCGCEEEHTHHRGNICPPPPAARTQYPYIDLEPRTCGCEEKK